MSRLIHYMYKPDPMTTSAALMFSTGACEALLLNMVACQHLQLAVWLQLMTSALAVAVHSGTCSPEQY